MNGHYVVLEGCCLAVLRDATHKYVQFGTASLPPILFDLEAEGGAELVRFSFVCTVR